MGQPARAEAENDQGRASPDALPAPPHVVAKVVQLAADPESNVADLAKVIATDPAMSAKLISAVNSPFYAPASPISSVERAVSTMGLRAVRNLVLCLGVQSAAGNDGLADFPAEAVWEGCLRRAVAAQCVAKRLGVKEHDELFTLGLCQDIGVLLLVRQAAALGEDLKDKLDRSAPARMDVEARYGETHDVLGARLFEEWSFGDNFVQALRYHHNPNDAPDDYRKSAQIAFTAEAITDVFGASGKQQAMKAAGESLAAVGLSAEELPQIVDEVADQTAAAAEMLQLKVGSQPNYQDIAAKAVDGMYALNLSLEELTSKLQDALAEQERLSEELKSANEQLKIMATTDGLTKLPNRRTFDEHVENALAKCAKENAPVSVIMLDVDHFKKFNDTHGHQAGDRVLVAVGKALKAAVRDVDFVARYGGEEFCAVFTSTDAKVGQVIGERIRKTIADAQVEHEGKVLSVTASIGGMTLVRDYQMGPGMFVKRADLALYKAKESGRNRVMWTQG